MVLSKDEKAAVIVRIQQRFGLAEGDTGASEVQVAILTERINYLTGHFRTHTADHAGRRGLLKLVGQRRNMLEYIKSRDNNRYRELIKELGLRK